MGRLSQVRPRLLIRLFRSMVEDGDTAPMIIVGVRVDPGAEVVEGRVGLVVEVVGEPGADAARAFDEVGECPVPVVGAIDSDRRVTP
ncbi:hypothetical protein [Pseudonocardia sp. ICBG1142]|uniref:hypothetical protein n=1 Tax=Pseudonocardia sp. ICBG1142 TaxID=2846760 RepID=UPI001CF678F9|nr:hypothetical protein [Pseudonocardia sp. ICBG1142]